MTPRLVLASSSPRRRQLLGELGLEFVVRPADADERPLPGEAPAAMVERLAREKAVASIGEGELVLAADTIVVLDGAILGKPRDPADAAAMLCRIAGREHQVFTGVALAAEQGRRAALRVVRTAVRMRALDAAEVASYVASGEPLDKAGAYAIQGWGAIYVETIVGNYSNVVGLPIPAVAELFAELGFDLARFRRPQLT